MFKFDNSFLGKRIIKLGKHYSEWTEEEKKDFILDYFQVTLSNLDSYVESLPHDLFSSTISTLKKWGFEIIYSDSVQYKRDPNLVGTLGEEIIMFHRSSGMLYYLNSFQKKTANGLVNDIKRSELYFCMSSFKTSIPLDFQNKVSQCSKINYADGSNFRMYSNIEIDTIKQLLDSCDFVKPWNLLEFDLGILNEGECFQIINGMPISVERETMKQILVN